MEISATVGLSSDVPFELARNLLGQLISDSPSGELRAAMRPIFHYPRLPIEAPVRRIKGELRMATAARAIRDFRFIARYLIEHGCSGLSLTVQGQLTAADDGLLRALSSVMPVHITYSSDRSRPAGARERDLETQQVMDSLEAIRAAAGGERSPLCCTTLGRYLACGDPWTALWLTDSIVRFDERIDGEIALMMSSAYLFTGQPHAAAEFCRIALEDTGVTRAQGLYMLSVLKIRHLPAALRDLTAPGEWLAQGWEILQTLPFDEVASEIVLNRNGLALLQLRTGHANEACATLRATIDYIIAHGHGETTAHSILLNNLGRALARTPGEANNVLAEEALERSVAIDGSMPENWLELAHLRAVSGEYAAAVQAAQSGCELSSSIPELYDVLGYALSKLEDHPGAAVAYQRAAEAGGPADRYALSSAREFLHAGQVDNARAALNSVAAGRNDADDAEFALLSLEAEQSRDPIHVENRLTAIVERFPGSETARQNLEMARRWRASEGV